MAGSGTDRSSAHAVSHSFDEDAMAKLAARAFEIISYSQVAVPVRARTHGF